MKLELGLDVLRSYKRLPYTAWHALAEFVDNSTQSYFNHREELDAAYSSEGSVLEISIIYDRDQGLLRISDNAMGMSYEELTRALHVGLPPDDTSGRSRYGLGMKMAACWYGNRWTVATKKLGETTEYTVAVDVEKAASGIDDLEESSATDLSPDDHYTRIEITNLNRTPVGRTLGKIREFLGGMYRPDIASGLLRLSWQSSALEGTADWVFLKDSLGNDYRKELDFLVNGKRVWGWVGVLDQGGRPKAGFAILHMNRMVQTWPEAWHPESIFGQLGGTNDLINQRLVGELHLDDFEVSHTKDAIHWMDDEEDLIQDRLREECAEYRDVARRSRKRAGANSAAIQAAARAIEEELNSGEMSDLIEDDLPPDDIIQADTDALIAETDTSGGGDFRAAIQHRGAVVEVLGILDSTKSANDPYVLAEASQPERVLVIINMNHPHLATVDDNGLLNYFRHCTYDAVAEWKARSQSATIEPTTIRRLKDQLLRVAIQIEMQEVE